MRTTFEINKIIKRVETELENLVESVIENAADAGSPADFFDDDELVAYVKDRWKLNEVYGDAEIEAYVKGFYDPGAVFDYDTLAKWAEENGFVKN